MTDLVRYHHAGSTATLTMDRPEKRNALSADLVAALKGRLAEAAENPDVRVVVLTGSGKAFSAGADLAALEALQEATPMENRADSEALAALFRQIYHFSKPVIAKVNGHAIGGGCGLAAACDFALAAEGAKLGFTEVRIGFVPAIVAVFMVRKLGETVVRDLLLRGRLVEASEAAGLGLIHQAVSADQLNEAVASLAEELATETSASALALTKQLLADVRGMGLHEALAYAVQANAFARGTADCQAGIRAFLAKEPPPWKREE